MYAYLIRSSTTVPTFSSKKYSKEPRPTCLFTRNTRLGTTVLDPIILRIPKTILPTHYELYYKAMSLKGCFTTADD